MTLDIWETNHRNNLSLLLQCNSSCSEVLKLLFTSQSQTYDHFHFHQLSYDNFRSSYIKHWNSQSCIMQRLQRGGSRLSINRLSVYWLSTFPVASTISISHHCQRQFSARSRFVFCFTSTMSRFPLLQSKRDRVIDIRLRATNYLINIQLYILCTVNYPIIWSIFIIHPTLGTHKGVQQH